MIWSYAQGKAKGGTEVYENLELSSGGIWLNVSDIWKTFGQYKWSLLIVNILHTIYWMSTLC